jgi:uncharacterized glyoxalase superfamily protein PhnB
MTDNQQNQNATVIPTLRYGDGAAAIDWLCKVFNFKKQLIVHDKDGAVAHAQLLYGNGMIMLGSSTNNEFHKLVKSPLESGGFGSQSAYIYVSDVDSHYKNAVAEGAEVVIDLKTEEHGGRSYSCRDPEGHIWNFGSYDPWAE